VETVLLELTREELGEHLHKSKSAALAILSEMANRLRETNAMLSQRAAKDVIKEIEENLTWGQRLADKVAELNGSWAFILFILALTFAWAGANKWLPPFDEYPYQFYNLVLAILVALQGPLIVMSQNRQSTKDRATAETDFRVNLKNEVGIEALQRELAAFRAEAVKRLDVLERSALSGRVRTEIAPKTPGGPLAEPKKASASD
jgi:CRP/FNR family cyclic AMP-dependent transcriptional regulator